MAQPTPPPSQGNTPVPSGPTVIAASGAPQPSTSAPGAPSTATEPTRFAPTTAHATPPPEYREPRPTSDSVSPDDHPAGPDVGEGYGHGSSETEEEDEEEIEGEDQGSDEDDNMSGEEQRDGAGRVAGDAAFGSTAGEGSGLGMAIEEEGMFAATGADASGGASGSLGGDGIGADPGALGKKKRATRKGKDRAAGLGQGLLGSAAVDAGGSELSIGSAEGSKAKRTKQKSGAGGPRSGTGGNAGGASSWGKGEKKDMDLFESEIVHAWNKEFGDVCKLPAAPGIAKA